MLHQGKLPVEKRLEVVEGIMRGEANSCLLYTSDAADE